MLTLPDPPLPLHLSNVQSKMVSRSPQIFCYWRVRKKSSSISFVSSCSISLVLCTESAKDNSYLFSLLHLHRNFKNINSELCQTPFLPHLCDSRCYYFFILLSSNRVSDYIKLFDQGYSASKLQKWSPNSRPIWCQSSLTKYMSLKNLFNLYRPQFPHL